MTFELPDLPYPYDALEPHVSAETLRYHHGKHHATYVEKLNGLLAESHLAGKSLEDVILAAAEEPGHRAIFNNAAQVWNHTFYWNCMTPNGGGAPTGDLAAKIEADFHGFDHFRTGFRAAAANQFGSGWAWLVLEDGKLRITATPNAEPPMVHGQHALLTCDVWEHAYYLDYQNRRPDYIDVFLEKLVNWKFVEQKLATARLSVMVFLSRSMRPHRRTRR